VHLKLGGALRATAGLRYVPIGARAMGYNLAQIHLGGDDAWEPYGLADDDVEQFQKSMYGVDLYVHMPYLINPANTDKRKSGFNKMTFKKFYRAAVALNARAVVLHPGSARGGDLADALKQVAETVMHPVDERGTEVLIETDAGGGTYVGSPENIVRVLEDIDRPDVVGMCLDTEHLYARGYDVFNPTLLDQYLHVWAQHIRLVHLNAPDPHVYLASHIDRHSVTFESMLLRDPWAERLNHVPNLVRVLARRFPCVLERSTLTVQKTDADYIRGLMESASA